MLRDRRCPVAELEDTPVTVSCRRYRGQDLREKTAAEHSECIASVTAGAVAKAKGSRWSGGLAGETSDEEGLVCEDGRF